VLPFRASSEHEHWGEGLADDLIAALSRFSSLAVLGRPSSFPFRDESDPRRLAMNLGARFLVTGTVRVLGSHFRVSTELQDGFSGSVLWADRFDRSGTDVLAMQDEIVEKIVATVVGRVHGTGAEMASRKRAETVGAFDLVLQGLQHADRLDPQSAQRAIDCFERALALEPDAPLALSMLALMRLRRWAFDPSSTSLSDLAATAERALALDPADSWSHLVMGQIDMYAGRLDGAEVRHKKAHTLNPYDARILALWSPLATYLGKPEEGLKLIERLFANLGENCAFQLLGRGQAVVLALRGGAQHHKLCISQFDGHVSNPSLIPGTQTIRAAHQDEPRTGYQAEGRLGQALTARRLTTTPMLPFERKASGF
jgi:TolB-like protein